MYTGIDVPVLGSRGRIATSTGAKENSKVILLSMASGESANPWNDDVGLDAPVFDQDSPDMEGRMQAAIESHFARLQAARRAKLIRVAFEPGDEDNGVHVRVRYMDMETDREQDLVKEVRRA